MTLITRENAAAFRRPLIRPAPVGPVQAYKTYSIAAPVSTHWRTISCETAGCVAHANGFTVAVDETSDLGARQAGYIRLRAGRPFSESREAGVTVFTFPAGTRCFEQHRTRRSRPPLFVVRGGDWRRHLGGQTVHASPEAWVDDFASHQDRLARARR